MFGRGKAVKMKNFVMNLLHNIENPVTDQSFEC